MSDQSFLWRQKAFNSQGGMCLRLCLFWNKLKKNSTVTGYHAIIVPNTKLAKDKPTPTQTETASLAHNDDNMMGKGTHRLPLLKGNTSVGSLCLPFIFTACVCM